MQDIVTGLLDLPEHQTTALALFCVYFRGKRHDVHRTDMRRVHGLLQSGANAFFLVRGEEELILPFEERVRKTIHQLS